MITSVKTTAVSQVIGLTLILGIIIIISGVYTTQVIPLQAQEQEINHYENRIEEMLELNTKITTTDTIPTEQIFNSSLSYPPLYPLPQQEHRLETKEETEITLTKPDGTEINHTTKPIVYTSEYNEITTPQIQIENGLVTTETDTTLNTTQTLISNEVIALQEVTGEITKTTIGASTVQIQPRNQTEQTINGEITVEIKSSVHNNELWKNELTEVPTVSSVEQENESIIITLTENEYTVITTTVEIKE